jgi:hypothetical protein
MVCGSIWLLKTGVIKLSEAAGGTGGLSVEVADKIRISTTYPALGLFLIGLLFIGTAIWFSRKPLPLTIVGQVQIDDPSKVIVSVKPDAFFSPVRTPDSSGKFDVPIPLDLEQLLVEIHAAGYDPAIRTATLRIEDAKKHKLALQNEIKFTKTSTASPEPGQIDRFPDGVTIPPPGPHQ